MERRRYTRYPVRQFRTGNPLYPDSPYKVLNLSLGGCLIQTHGTVSGAHPPINVEIPLPLQKQGLLLPAVQVWSYPPSDPSGREFRLCAFRFLNIQDATLRMLEAYIDFLARDVQIARLETAWAAFSERQEKLAVLAAYQERQHLEYLH